MHLQKEFYNLLLINNNISTEEITKKTGIGKMTILVTLKGMRNRGEIGKNNEPIYFERYKENIEIIKHKEEIEQLSLF